MITMKQITTLEEILQELGVEVPFDNNQYTSEGLLALDKLMRITSGLECIGALGKVGDKLEAYCDEIVAMDM